MTTVRMHDYQNKTWSLTTEHAASSYRQPVLVGPDNNAYGPADQIGDCTASVFVGMLYLDNAADGDCDLIRAWNRLSRI